VTVSRFRYARWILPVTFLVLIGGCYWTFFGIHRVYKDGPEAYERMRHRLFRLGALPEGQVHIDYASLQDLHYGFWYSGRGGPEYYVFQTDRMVVDEFVSKWKLKSTDQATFASLTRRFRQVPRLSRYTGFLTAPVQCYGDGDSVDLCYSPSSRWCIVFTTFGL
ncbi:MAG: hypothetical protein WCS70_06920, partial [Verrucomicrobiota bacterium]